MADDEDDKGVDYEEFEKLQKEIDSWKSKYKSLEIKKRESDLNLNKIKTEINSLRSVDKLWKEASKTVFLNLRDVKNSLDVQVDQIIDGLSAVSKGGERVTSKSLHMKSIKKVIAQLQSKIATQDETISSLHARIRSLTAELKDKSEKVERLSQGIEEEVERLIKPMRDKLAETVVTLMKEKASRAQERRELADLWPKDSLLPSLLLRYRSLSTEENDRRIQYAMEQNASLALQLEIQANVTESKMWEIKYDDYGRQFYQHRKTGQSVQESPEIMNYQPPPGRDEDGNIIITEENDANNWIVLNDNRGQVFWKHKLTSVTTYYPPYAYKKLPPGKTREQIVAEASGIVLDYMKEKIIKHIAIKKKRKDDLENPLTPEERKKKEKAERNRTAEEIAALPDLSEESEPMDLSLYQYDIETVEMLAYDLLGESNNNDKDMEALRKERRSFLDEKEVRKFAEDLYEGKTLLETDLTEMTIEQLRGIVEELALFEEKYETKLERTRNNLKDFSFLLTERINQERSDQINTLKEEKIAYEKEIRTQQKQLLAEKKAKLKEKKDLLEKERALQMENQSLGETESKLTEDEENALNESLDTASQDPIPEGEEGEEGEESNNKSDNHGESESKGNMYEEQREDGGSTKSQQSGNKQLVDSTIPRSRIGSSVTALLPLEEDERAIEMLEKAIDQPIIPPSDEQLAKEIYGDNRLKLFGEILIDHREYDASEEFLDLCNHLSNFTLFCGFMNLKPSELSDESNRNYSFLEESLNNNENENMSDDEWLSCHFFLGCNQEQLNNHREVLRKEYSSKSGFLPIGPFDTEKIIFHSRTESEIARSKVFFFLFFLAFFP
jgi:hypothetical protein